MNDKLSHCKAISADIGAVFLYFSIENKASIRIFIRGLTDTGEINESN